MNRLIILFLLMVPLFTVKAQINLKKKLEKKADQTLDNLLFGKKKKNEQQNVDGTEGDFAPSAGTESTTKEKGELAYVREPINFDSFSTEEIVHFRQLINFLPDEFDEYRLSTEPDGATMKFGENEYSMAVKEYGNGQELSVSIFDYLNTTSMLTNYSNQMEYESTEGMMKSVVVLNHPGWFSQEFDTSESTLFFVVNDRFAITMNGEDFDQEDFIGFASTLTLDKLPGSNKALAEE